MKQIITLPTILSSLLAGLVIDHSTSMFPGTETVLLASLKVEVKIPIISKKIDEEIIGKCRKVCVFDRSLTGAPSTTQIRH